MESGSEAEVSSTVVVGVDGRAGSSSALERAVAIASERGAALRLVHVTPGLVLDGAGEVTRAAEEIATAVLDDARSSALAEAPDLTVTTVHRVGGRSAGIAAAAGPEDLVVVGRSRHRGPAWLPHGSLASGVVARHPGPVLVVPEGEPPGRSVRQVVVASAATGRPESGLAELLAWAEEHDASVAVVNGWWVPDPYVDLAEQRVHAVEHEERALLRMQQTLLPHRAAHPGVLVELRVRHGRPAHVLLEESRDADLLALPRHRAPGLLPGYVGGTTRALLRESSVPVLLLPATGGAADDLVLEEHGALVR